MSSHLFTPLSLKSITLKNRIVVSPMCQYSSVDGFANDWHLVHLGSRAVGGASLIIFEATAVSAEGRISLQDLGIWKDKHKEKLKQITDFISSQGTVPGVQLAHAGRKASTFPAWKGRGQVPFDQGGWKTVSASSIPFLEKEDAPLELDEQGIKKVIDDFAKAAKRALEAGFKVIEIHAAHGYLIHQFLSPLSNQRTDSYGGSFENRIRLLLQVIEAIQKVWPDDLPIFVRISATDWADGGWEAEQSTELAKILTDKGISLIDVSSGGLVSYAKVPIGPSYQVPFSAKIKKQTHALTAAVGLITEAQQAEDILKDGEADLIVMAREMLRDPYFPLHAARQLGEDIEWPVQYDRAKPAH
ncbi:NADH:flavin oxidoreductase/NADH oxidase [Dyadobacter arcticus]|uniref:2,4-dienoyl-CoA reductase-like NADH-dependent reductase (Old Yellow Enzyme family) n=1 Tax=Dyadobacter arcticus TaxID=1078754 RepID=A0ABX0UJM0_9BACT|nr:NADH:flavin oxidoreductase/NADH oxidase [Dyadobacter arcticus]NIJ53126.1 2,4-dienoyl-CoA reductase-like NADH-dependent reductase (Old Yellow Enzyme family) [Dyadobacter arcticus]